MIPGDLRFGTQFRGERIFIWVPIGSPIPHLFYGFMDLDVVLG